jgi:hypothetical protein
MIPVIELFGTYHDMGLQYGKQFKSQIAEFAKTRMTRLISFVKKYGKIDVTEQEVLEIAATLLPIHEQYDAEIWQEFLGIAKGAEISLTWLLVSMSYTDLRDYICKVKGFNDAEVRFEGCTGFILDKTMSVDNNIIIGQTWDMSVEAMDYLVIVKKNPVHGPRMLYLTTMGAVALLGLNSNNLAIGTTNLMANDCDDGINYLFTISKALMARDYSSMLEDIVSTKRMSGHSFLCASTDTANLIEASATHYLDYKIDHYPLVKTNNYSEGMRQYELIMPEQRRRNSLFRYGRATSLLVEHAKWSYDELWQLLADQYRSNSGAAICNEDYASQYGEFATLATVLLIPAQQAMWICRGGSATGELQIVTL